MKKATLAIVLYRNKKKENDSQKFPLKLRVTFNRKTKFYAIGKYSFTDDELKVIQNPASRSKNKEIRDQLTRVKGEAQVVIDKLSVFSFEGFEKRFLNKRGSWSELYATIETHIKELETNEQISTASTFRSARYSFKAFKPRRKTIDFQDITPTFLNEYERWMLKEEKSPSTISINTRCVRTLFNMAIKNGDVHEDYYPFGNVKDGKYQPPKVRNPKKATSKENIKKILEYKPEKGSKEHFNRDMWIFSYICGGINMADIFRLKYKDISGSEITFTRKKTSSSRSLKPVVIPLREEIENIIKTWGRKPVKKNNYVFPILVEDLTAKEEHARIKQGTKQVNTYIRKVAVKVGVEQHLTTYTARHSFASSLASSNEAISIISAMMGHSNSVVTQLYINDTEIEEKRKAMDSLF